MKTLLNQFSKPLAFAASLALLATAPLAVHAQGAAGNEAGGGNEKSMGDQQSATIKPATKEKFIAAYSEIRDVQQKYSQKLQNIDDKSKARELQQQAQTEMVGIIEDKGLSIKQYNQIVNQMRNNPELRKEVEQQAQG